MTRYPHFFSVFSNEVVGFPPTKNNVLLFNGECNAQVFSGDGTMNENESALYSHIVYYPITINDLAVPGQDIQVSRGNLIITGNVVNQELGQISNRIWIKANGNNIIPSQLEPLMEVNGEVLWDKNGSVLYSLK